MAAPKIGFSWILCLTLMTLLVHPPATNSAPEPPDADDDDTSIVDKSKFVAPKLQWYTPPERTCPMENDFCNLPKPANMPSKAERRQFAEMAIAAGGAASAVAAGAGVVLEALGHVNSAMGNVANAGGSANGIIAGAITNMHGIGGLIRGGIDLAKTFGLGPTTRAIIVDNRCGACELWVRCTSQKTDSGWIPLEYPDGYILKFVTHLPGWEYGLGNFGFIFYTCQYEDRKAGKSMTKPAFGGEAPRETINLFEVRKRGLFRMDQETGRIDARQSYVPW